METILRPRVFLDINIASEPAGRVVIELFVDKAPKACENFRGLCAPSKPDLPSYKLNQFHRVIDEFMVQAGDITNGDGTGGKSIWGEDFEEENIGWRDIDKEGLLCMVNRGKGACNSQFFITLVPCEHLNGKHTVFGHIVAGTEALHRVARVGVDDNDRPLEPVLIAHCGELERRKKAATGSIKNSHSVQDRGRKALSRSGSATSTSRSRSSSSRERGSRKDRRSKSPATRASNGTKKRPRRRSDHSIDENLRGRVRRRSKGPSRSPSVIDEAEESRSPRRPDPRGREPSRSPQQRGPRSSDYRRRPSLPNNYERWERRHRNQDDGRHDDRLAGRLDSRNGSENSWAQGEEIKFKGRGSMKYRERK